eukprot:g2855.t2
MRWIDTVASYLPSLIVNHLINRTTNEELPSRQEYDTVCLFADVSGFTALSEAMMSSTEGVEGLAKHLNAYFGQMVKIIASEGGDVFKFAGDALIVLWPPPAREALTDIATNGREKESGEREGTTPMERRVRRAAQCAFAIQEELHDAELTKEVRLSVKIGIGMGKVSVLHLGGVYKRMEYIAVGEPLLQAFTAEHHAEPGDVIISMQAHKLVKDHFHNKFLFPDNFCRIGKELNYNPMRKQNKVNMLKQSLDDPLLEVKVKGYIPGAVLRNLRPDSPEDEHWSNEIRRVTVLFVNLGLNDQTLLAAAVYDEAMKEMHQVMVAVQESVYEYEGSINKFLMDDKGSTLLAVYGLPPVGHADDPIRGVLAALRLCERLFELAKVGSVGITTGEAFCGVVGSKTRKEYTILGDSVNLAARLMQRAVSEDGGVMCELATKRACGGLLQFKGRGDFRIKGKTAAAKVFQPYPEDFPKPKPPQYLGANVYGLIHQQQRQNYAMHKLLTSLQAYFARPAPVKEISTVSSPSSADQRPRFSGSQRGSQRGSAYMRTSMLSSAGNGVGENEEEEEEQEDTLLGLGGHTSEPSDEGSDIDIMEHAELQEPGYHPTNPLHLPFQTGPLPLEMGGELPYEGLRQDLFHQEAGGSGVQVGVENGAALPAGLSESKESGATAAAPRLDLLEKSSNSRDLLSAQRQQQQQDGGGAAAAVDPAAAHGKEPMQKSSSLTAKVFAAARTDRGSAGSARLSAASAAGTVSSGGAGDRVSPDNMSPTSNATSTDAPPVRELASRRQGDSGVRKLFRTADDGNGGGPSSQPTSPSAASNAQQQALRKEHAQARAQAATTSPEIVPSALAPARAQAASNVAPAAKGAPSTSVDGGGGVRSGSGPGTAGGSWQGRKGLGGDVGSRRDAVGEGEGSGADQEGKMEALDQEVNPSNAGDSKEELVVPPPPRAATRGSFNRGSFNRGSFNRGSFNRGSFTGSVLADEDEIYATKSRRRRSSQRLSISQNGMVPLPASAGIPPSDLGASGSCSLPRYSRFPKPQFVTGLGSSGHGSIRNGPLPGGGGGGGGAISAQTLNWGGFGPAPPTLSGSSSLLTAYIPSAMKNGKRMDDSTSSSTPSANGMRSHQAMMNGDGYDEYRLQVVVPRSWKWSSLPDFCHRLPAINAHEIPTFKALVDHCWEIACGEAEVKGWSQPAPARESMVLNILGTRVMLPTEPDYDISLLPHFVKEACGTRGFRGFMDRRRSFPQDHGGHGVGGCAVDLCLVPRVEIINVQSRWLNSRISLLQHKIALVATKTGSVVLLEGLPGSGKTEALSVFAARTMPRTALIHFTAASPYHANKSFGGWSMVLQQYLDSLHKLEMQAGREDLSGHGGGRRPSVPPGSGSEQANGASILGRRPLGHRDRMLLRELEGLPEMHTYAHLVNDVLGTNIPNKVVAYHHSSASSSSTSVDGANETDEDDYDESSSVGHEQKLRLQILLQLVKNMSATKRRVVVIDDAQFLDKESWTLALHIATGGPLGTPLPLMLILSFRPLLHYRAIFASIAPDYKALTELEHVSFLKIDGAPPEEVEELVSEKLGTNVVEISDSLFGLMEELCTGNPLMITELVSHLKMMEPKQLRYFEIRSEEGDQGDSHNNIDVAVQVSLTESFRLSDSLLPEKVNALLTSQTDRLNSCQLMALKVASLIGKEFSTWFLYEVYPIKGHKTRLLRELAELEDQGFLVEVQGKQAGVVIEREGWARPSLAAGGMSAGGTSGSCGDSSLLFKRSDSTRHLWGIPNIVYLFTHGFMMEMLQLKMLKSQTSLLKGSIQKLKDRLETQKRHKEFKNYTMDRSQKQKSGTLSVMKYKVTMSQAATNARETTRRRKDSVTSRAMRRVKRPVHQKWTEALDWKKRTCLLTGESLSLFSDPKDTEPSQIVYLRGANAEPELGQAFKEAAFRVETNKWKKGDELVDGSERRTFTFLAESKDEKELWLYQIRHCIEVLKVLNDEAGPSNMDRMMQGSSGRSGRSSRFRGTADGGLDEDKDDVDSTLMVRVEGADELILEENYGKVYPYCLVDLDDQNRRTSSVQCASVSPSWQEDLTFDVSVQQWILSNLRVQVWHKDLFLTDDFLGHVTIPLTDVAVQKWDDDVDAPAPELKWYNLESRGRTKRATGRLQLGVRLLMNKSTSARASAVGGVDKLKDIAERRMDISSHAARVAQIQQRKQSLPGLLHHVSQASDSHNAHHHPHHHPGAAHMILPNQRPMLSRGTTNPHTRKLTELLPMVGRSDVDLDQLDTHTFYCKDRKENQYGPFPAKQLVEAHNAGYINDRKILVKEARMKGDFRPMGARSLMHGPSSDETFKSLRVWPQVDAHHPLADRILSPGDGCSKDFRQWGFNIFGLETHELGMLAATVLAETGLPRVFGISMKTFAHFMSAVGFFMGRNPRVSYHNLYHAVDVMHATYLTLGSMGASGLLTETEQLALILSALCHDLDHPGLTNSFQTATESPLANLYNDQAPLEHHHLAIMFQILRREGCDILGHLEKPQKTRIREVMIQGILATEMSEHGTHITKVDKLTSDFPEITHRIAEWAAASGSAGDRDLGNPGSGSRSSPSPSPLCSAALDAQSSAAAAAAVSRRGKGGHRAQQVPGAEAAALGLADGDRLTVASALLHAADLSSPGRPFATCEMWVVRLLEEFKFQAEQERQRGLRVTVLEGLPSASQPGFIDAFLLPFFTALLPMAPGLDDEYIPNLRDNRNRWAAIAEQEEQFDFQAESAQPGRINGKAGDRNSTGSTSSGPGSSGGGKRNSGTDSNVDGGGGGSGWGGDGHQRQALPHSNHSSLNLGGQRRYSGGTIGIASMLGSLSTVPTGRSISDGSMDRRVSSVLGTQETPPEFMALGNNGAAWRRQSAMGAPRAGGGGGLGYPRWGAARGPNGPRGGQTGWGEEMDEKGGGGGGGESGLTAVAGAGAARWSIDVGAEGRTEFSNDEQHEEAPEPSQAAAAAAGSPVEGNGKRKAKSSPDGGSPVRDAAEVLLAGEASPIALPEALPE